MHPRAEDEGVRIGIAPHEVDLDRGAVRVIVGRDFEHLTGGDPDPELLAQLALERLLDGLAGLELAARELPQEPERPARRPSGEQDAPLARHDRRRHADARAMLHASLRAHRRAESARAAARSKASRYRRSPPVRASIARRASSWSTRDCQLSTRPWARRGRGSMRYPGGWSTRSGERARGHRSQARPPRGPRRRAWSRWVSSWAMVK